DTSIYAREQAIIASNSLTNECTSNSVTVSPLEIFSGVMDLNQLNPIFNSFPVLARNYAQLHIQLWMQDFLQDLKVVWLNKNNPVENTYLAYAMIPPEKPDIICLRNKADNDYSSYAIRLVNMEGKPNTTTIPTATIKNEAVIVDMIRQTRLVNFPTQVLRTQSSNYP
ncbi:MAG: hypothetical protein EZS28_054765, partial [Streblomastix strix]